MIKKDKEAPMKLRTKMMILLVAALLTFIGFNLMISPALVDMTKAKYKTNYEITVTARAGTGGHLVPLKTG
jgi:hypothetical protein